MMRLLRPALAGLLLFAAHPAAADGVLALSVARSANGAPGAAHVHRLSPLGIDALPGPVRLPGAHLIQSPWLLEREGSVLLATSGDDGVSAGATSGPAYLVNIPAAPLRPGTTLPLALPDGRALRPLALLDAATSPALLCAIDASAAEDATGSLRLLPLPPGAPPSEENLSPPVTPTGRPVAAASAALGGSFLLIIDQPGSLQYALQPGHRDGDVLILTPPQPLPLRGAAVPEISPGAAGFWLARSGVPEDDPAADLQTRVLFTGEGATLLSTAADALPGLLVPGGLLAITGDRAWAAVRTPGDPFLRLALIAREGAQLVVRQRYPVYGANRQFHLARAPHDPEVLALACNERLELWRAGALMGEPVLYPADISALAWGDMGLHLAAGPVVYQADESSGVPQRAWEVREGRVEALVLLPGRVGPPDDLDGDGLEPVEELRVRTGPMIPDTDQDGVPDGADAQPALASPVLLPAPLVRLRAEDAGRELRVIVPGLQGATEGAHWRIRNAGALMPFAVLYPTAGGPGDYVFTGLNPARLAEAPARPVPIEIEAFAADGTPATNSPATVHLEIVPPPPARSTILWLLDRDFPALRDRLSDAPLYATHAQAGATADRLLPGHKVVVLDASAALRGVVSRQSLIDYVAAGGAVLVLGEYLGPESAAALLPWFEALGLRIDPGLRTAGNIDAAPYGPYPGRWGVLHFDQGAGLFTEPEHVVVPGGALVGSAAYAVRTYGFGRVAALAGPEPLKMADQGEPTAQAFLDDVFTWLLRGNADLRDFDADGLPAALEDRDGSGGRDPGETDALLADTDGDGLFDGLEDLNRNGEVDPGETDPRNRDTDNDGRWDGADSSPTPQTDAPHIARVEPSHAPAEGGYPVLLSGRGLPADARVFFGERAAEDVLVQQGREISLRVPPYADAAGGIVDVRLEWDGGAAVLLPGGFAYAPRTEPELTLSPEPPVGASDDVLFGALNVALNWPATVPVTVLSVVVEVTSLAEEAIGALTLDITPLQPGLDAGVTTVAEGRQLLVVQAPEGQRLSPGLLARIAWTATRTGGALPRALRWTPLAAIARTPEGAALPASTEVLEVQVDTPELVTVSGAPHVAN